MSKPTTTTARHDYYNTDNFPILVAHHGPWDIYRKEDGYCAAIPADPESGHSASHFGTMAYVHSLVKEGRFTILQPCQTDQSIADVALSKP